MYPADPLFPKCALQYAFKYGSAAAEGPRAWSKYTAGTSAHKRLQGGTHRADAMNSANRARFSPAKIRIMSEDGL